MSTRVRVFLPLAAAAALVWLCGCGKSEPPPDTGPFEKAITAYLADKSMEIKVSEFKELKVDGSSAEASASMEHAGGLVGPKVRFKFWFALDEDGWTVTGHQQQ